MRPPGLAAVRRADAPRGGRRRGRRPGGAALVGHERDPLESMLQLRLMGAVHRLALSGRAPDLAAAYPSCGGDGDPERAWPAFRHTVEELMDEVRAHVERPVQTNEVGRSRALACGFLWLAAETGLPLRLFELGSSAGLNLRWDAYGYRSGALEFGDLRSAVRFTDFLASGSPPVPERVEVAARSGCDPRPVDLSTDDGVLTLRSYIWADQLDRLELLDGAISVAARVPVNVERADTVRWLERSLAGAAAESCRVVFHSIVMQYVEETERERIGRRSRRPGSAPRRSRPWPAWSSSPVGMRPSCG